MGIRGGLGWKEKKKTTKKLQKDWIAIVGCKKFSFIYPLIWHKDHNFLKYNVLKCFLKSNDKIILIIHWHSVNIASLIWVGYLRREISFFYSSGGYMWAAAIFCLTESVVMATMRMNKIRHCGVYLCDGTIFLWSQCTMKRKVIETYIKQLCRQK